MVPRTVAVAGAAAVALGLGGAVIAFSASGDEPLGPAAQAVADLPAVADFSLEAAGGDCAYDPARGGLVYDDLTVESRSTGVLELSFHVQRDDLDDVLPGYVTTVLTFGEGSRSHTFDLVVPVTRQDHEAGYDECRWTVGGE